LIPLYAIKHVPSGKFLPEPTGRSRRGGSHVGPEDPNEHPPRFFTKESTAKIVLSHWLRGIVVAERGTYGSPDYEPYEDIRTIPVPTRKREEMQIVKFNLIEEVSNDHSP